MTFLSRPYGTSFIFPIAYSGTDVPGHYHCIPYSWSAPALWVRFSQQFRGITIYFYEAIDSPIYRD